MTALTTDVLALLHDAATAVGEALTGVTDWGLAGTRSGQHHSDLAADEAALSVLLPAGVAVLSEESGLHHADRPVMVVVDPLDGSTNAARGIPWYATSLAALEGDTLIAAAVVNQADGTRFEATAGGGARRDGEPITPSACTALDAAVVGLSGYPPVPLGWKQYRALGAVALDLCAVAAGVLDAYIDCSDDAHGPWDFLGATLVCREAGAAVADGHGRSLETREPAQRRVVLGAASAPLLDEVAAARSRW